MKTKLKIAHIQLLPLVTGVQRVTLDELERLDNNLFERHIICKESGPMTDEAISKNINCIYNNRLVRNISIVNDFLAFCKLFVLFRRHGFDIVHTHSSKTGVIGRIAAKLAGVPTIVHTVHGFAFPAANSKLEKYVFWVMEWLGTRCSNKIICLHNADKQIAKDILGAKEEQLVVLPNGIDTVKYSPACSNKKLSVRQKIGINDDTVIVGFVGRLWKQKNPEFLIDRAIELLSAGTKAEFILVGDGELRESLVSKVSDSGFSGSIHFLGWRDDTEELLKGFDIFVLPSLWEGMPLAILEAQSTGLPCLVSNIQGNNHLVEDGNSGFLFDLNEPERFRDKIELLIGNKDIRKQLGSFSRKKTLSDHDINNRVNKIAKVYLRS